jgi:hypothetical protein
MGKVPGATKCHIPHLLLQFVSQDNDLVLPSFNQESPYPVRDLDDPRFNFTVFGLELLVSVWFVIVVTVLFVQVFFSSSLVLVILLTDSHYLSICIYHLSNRYHHSSSVTSPSLGSRLLYSSENKHKRGQGENVL